MMIVAQLAGNALAFYGTNQDVYHIEEHYLVGSNAT
jgi:hypothetical protein